MFVNSAAILGAVTKVVYSCCHFSTLPSASGCLATRASPALRSGAKTLAPLRVLAARLHFAGHGRLQLRAGGSVVFCTTLGRKSTALFNRLLLAPAD